MRAGDELLGEEEERVGSSERAIFTDGRDEGETEEMGCEGVGGTNTRRLVEWGDKSRNRTPSDVSKPWHFASTRGSAYSPGNPGVVLQTDVRWEVLTRKRDE